MVLLTVKILGSWSLLSMISAFTWSRSMAAGRCMHVNEIVAEITPRLKPESQTATSQLHVERF